MTCGGYGPVTEHVVGRVAHVAGNVQSLPSERPLGSAAAQHRKALSAASKYAGPASLVA